MTLRLEEKITDRLAIRADLKSSEYKQSVYDAVKFAESMVGKDFSPAWEWGNELYYLDGISHRQLRFKT